MILRNQIFDGFIIFEFQGHEGQKGRYRYSKVQLVKMQTKNFKISLPTFMRVNKSTPNTKLDPIL